MSTRDGILQAKIMKEALQLVTKYDDYGNTPELVASMHEIVKSRTGVLDPYKKIKQEDIKAALLFYPRLKEFMAEKDNSLYWALKTSAVGNIIDKAIYKEVDIEGRLEEELLQEFAHCDFEAFFEKIITAKRVLIIGDNAGETVFDRILIHRLQPIPVWYAVRSQPVINDATYEDAVLSCVHEDAEIISTGCSAPGAVLRMCSKEFIERFYEADVVISKGQGNYEALSQVDREIYFLLKVKCPVISTKMGIPLDSYVFMKREP
jgi:hypothetical protein